jgi:hypothetical protein
VEDLPASTVTTYQSYVSLHSTQSRSPARSAAGAAGFPASPQPPAAKDPIAGLKILAGCFVWTRDLSVRR